MADDNLGNGCGCILLFGMPRSGTTWLGKLFDSHPHTLYRHEPDIWHRFSWTRYPTLEEADAYAEALRTFVVALPQMNAVRVVGKQPLFPKAHMSAARFRLIQGTVQVARFGSRLHRGFPVFFSASGARDPQRRIVWKSVSSLGRLGMALEVLEQARGIHIIRHPCGQIASLLRGLAAHKLRGGLPSEDYGIFKFAMRSPLGQPYGLTTAYLDSLTPEERLAWRWVLLNEKPWLEACDSKRYLPVCYEDICDDPLAGTERMFTFSGLDMHRQARAFIESSAGENQDAYFSVFKNSRDAAWRWRNELDTATIDRIMAIVEQSRIGRFYLACNAVAARA